MRKILLYAVFFIQGGLFLNASVKEKLTEARLGVYQQSPAVDARHLETLYKQVLSPENPDDKLHLKVRMGILFCEAYLYHSEAFPLMKPDELKDIYRELRKEVLKSKSPHILTENSEFSFYMMRLFPKKRLAYLMDARTFLLKSFWLDAENPQTQLSMGKWWSYRIMNIKNHEFNHSLAQADKYLSDENITALLNLDNDPWYRIDIANCLYLRAVIDRRALRILQAEKCEKTAENFLPPNSLHALVRASHADTPVRLF